MITITSAGVTDIGRIRKGNEDSLLVDDDLTLYVVADGMGGHRAGEVASRIVVDSIRNTLNQIEVGNNGRERPGMGTTLSPAARRLMAAIYQANDNVYRTAEGNELYHGMGSTVSAVYFTDQTLIAANVGDSPIYLVRNDAIETISTPHTVAAEHAAIAPKGAKPLGPQYRHMLTRAMGIDKSVAPDTCEHQVFDNDILIICSDGLSDKVAPGEILAMTKGTSPAASCCSLVDLANERGGEDNITVIVLHVKRLTENKADHNDAAGDGVRTKNVVEKEQQISVEYDTEDGSYRSAVKTIDVDGIFIETSESFFVGQEISLTFAMGDRLPSFMITGKVAHRQPQGIEIIFENLTKDQQNWIESIQKKI